MTRPNRSFGVPTRIAAVSSGSSPIFWPTRGREDELRELAAQGHEEAPWALLALLLSRGRVDEAVKARHAYDVTDDSDAWYGLVKEVYDRGEEITLPKLSATGDDAGVLWLAQMLEDQLRDDKLRELADGGTPIALGCLANVLAAKGEIDEAIEVLDELCDIEGYDGPHQLAELLARHGREEELRQWVAEGPGPARVYLPSLLADQEREDELRELMASADFPDSYWAKVGLAAVLAKQGREAELRQLVNDSNADFGDGDNIKYYLVELLARQERSDELRRMADEGSRPARRRLALLLREQGRERDLWLAASAGDRYARVELVALLAEQGRNDDLRQMAAAGDSEARRRLAGLRPGWRF
jgi:hypothetical protein